jgi:hypothetical protein
MFCVLFRRGAHLRHLPSANDVAAPPTASYQSAFTLPQVGEQSAHGGSAKSQDSWIADYCFLRK